MLPEEVYVDEAKAVLDTFNLDCAQNNTDVSTTKATTFEQTSSSVLKLRGSAGTVHENVNLSTLKSMTELTP